MRAIHASYTFLCAYFDATKVRDKQSFPIKDLLHLRFVPMEDTFCHYLTTLSVKGTFCIKTSIQSSCEPDRSPSLQYSDRDNLFLSRTQYHCRSVRSTSTSTPDEAPYHNITVEEVWVYPSSADDPMELAARVCASS